MRVYKDHDADVGRLIAKKISVVGYGSQGRAHALNLRDSGIAAVTVALHDESKSIAVARADGFAVAGVSEAAGEADLVMLLAPDELQRGIYEGHIAPNLREGAAVLFAHGLNVHFGLIAPRPDLDVVLVAPKGPGRAVRDAYLQGGGVACLLAVAQDASGQALDLGLAYASAIGAGRAAILETTFGEECETDLFGEQAVLCGGMVHLVRAGFETLVEAGYAPEMAYLECVHEVKLIADLLHERGVAGMNRAISNTAEYGEYAAGPRLVTVETKAEMKRILEDIRSGGFAREWMTECAAGQPTLKAARRRDAAHPLEAVGERLRAMTRSTATVPGG